jgi:hypothetical protein
MTAFFLGYAFQLASIHIANCCLLTPQLDKKSRYKYSIGPRSDIEHPGRRQRHRHYAAAHDLRDMKRRSLWPGLPGSGIIIGG